MAHDLFFRDVLRAKGIEPSTTLVMRHQPKEPALRRQFSWILMNRPDLFNWYQQTQGPREEKQLTRAKYLASFVGGQSQRAIFAGLYRNHGFEERTREEYWKNKARKELKGFGMGGFTDPRPRIREFNLELMDLFSDWKGRLVIEWKGEKSWSRWAHKNKFAIDAIATRTVIAPEMPSWHDIVLPWSELSHLWPSWKAALTHWRGIYFICDCSDSKGYVGSACGMDNLLGRWTNYASSGHGGNKLLRKRDHNNFVFSILELVSPTALAVDVFALEQSWKKRLSTLAPIGLNDN